MIFRGLSLMWLCGRGFARSRNWVVVGGGWWSTSCVLVMVVRASTGCAWAGAHSFAQPVANCTLSPTQEDFFRTSSYFGAAEILLSSASSKTSLSLAFMLKRGGCNDLNTIVTHFSSLT